MKEATQVTEFLWERLRASYPKKQEVPRDVKGNVVFLGGASATPEVMKILNKGPKFATEPAVKPSEMLALVLEDDHGDASFPKVKWAILEEVQRNVKKSEIAHKYEIALSTTTKNGDKIDTALNNYAGSVNQKKLSKPLYNYVEEALYKWLPGPEPSQTLSVLLPVPSPEPGPSQPIPSEPSQARPQPPCVAEELSQSPPVLTPVPSPAPSHEPDSALPTNPVARSLKRKAPEDSSSDKRRLMTPKTRLIQNLRVRVSKLKKKLTFSAKRTATRSQMLEQLKSCVSVNVYNFVLSQVQAFSVRPRGMRWTAGDKRLALNLYLKSPAAYRVLKRYLQLPSKSFDEMHVKAQLQYSTASDSVLWEQLQAEGLSFLMTNRLNQDCNSFFVIRQKGGFQDSPDTEQFKASVKALMTENLMQSNRVTNCEEDLDEVLLCASSFPLGNLPPDVIGGRMQTMIMSLGLPIPQPEVDIRQF
ncbi:hypothetical protein HPB47_017378 [Ixodes persulcatus]|uniref:Uncharacterized protein n=1 Tax=Ixodes persulcatus TaxID=34615 RepID=A0AC60QPD2_IXOPE|nr:hypothetical protein HPB47_017378 [Ixodes persulcatus]